MKHIKTMGTLVKPARVSSVRTAQANLFIIIGLVILIIIISGGYLYYTQTKQAVHGALQQETVPDALVPLQGFITQCLQNVATDALVKIGEHGGYVEINAGTGDVTSKQFRINDQNPTEADAFSWYGQYIPYWWYLQTPYGCVDCYVSNENIPTLEEIQQQIQHYVARELDTCLGNFSSYTEQGFRVTPTGHATSQVYIQDKTVLVTLAYPLTIGKETVYAQVKNFYVELPLAFKDVYQLAYELVALEMINQTFEHLTMTLVSLYSGIDANKLPPIADAQETYSIVRWTKIDVKNKLHDLLTSTIPLLQFDHTQDAQKISTGIDAYQKGISNLLYVEGIEQEYPFEVHALYPHSSDAMHVVITPSNGEILEPEVKHFKEFFGVLPPQQENNYRFFYDISYPVLLHIRDPMAFQGKGYNFYVALETNILDNRDLLQWHRGKGTVGQVRQKPSLNIKFRQVINTSLPSGYDPATNTTTVITLRNATQTLFCQKNQRLSGAIDITVMKQRTPLSDVQLTFGCGTYDYCSIGTTSNGSLATTLPLCEGGWLKAEKEGFGTAIVPLTTQIDKDDHVPIRMQPTKKFTVTAKTILTTVLNQTPLSQRGSLQKIASTKAAAQPLVPGEKVVLTIASSASTVLDPVITRTIMLTSDTPDVIIDLPPNKYSVLAVLTSDRGITIPPETRTVGDQTFTIDGIELKPALLGGVSLDSTTGAWDVTEQALQKDHLVFYLLKTPPPQKLEDLNELQRAQTLAREYRLFLEPDFR